MVHDEDGEEITEWAANRKMRPTLVAATSPIITIVAVPIAM
jgi:hypothetical protein